MMDPKQPTAADLEIGRRIRSYRTSMGMSQTALGDRVGVTFQQIQKYEKGVNRVSTGRLVKLAHALNVTVTELAGEHAGIKVHGASVEARQAASAIDEIENQADRDVVLSTVKILCRRFRSVAQPALVVALAAPIVLAMSKAPNEIGRARGELAAKMREHVDAGRSYPDTAPEDFPYASSEQLRTLSTKQQHRLPGGWRFDEEPATRR
jgi:transcriptional regulator with XRE-family HTH domain